MALEAAISMSMAHPNVVVTYAYDTKLLVQAPSATVEPADGGVYNDIVNPGGHGTRTTPAAVAADAITAAKQPAAAAGCCDAIKLHIIQEYCNAGTVRVALEHGFTGCVLSDGTSGLLALHLALDVARGMQHIHSCRIVHGDLKPENILLTWQSAAAEQLSADRPIPQQQQCDLRGLNLYAKVADFGLSIAMPEDATHASNLFRGTPMYLAPEVANEGQLSFSADVWSFGLLLIELYFGCSMHSVHATCAAFANNQDRRDRPQTPLHTFLQDIVAVIPDRPYAELVSRCLSQEPRARPSFAELAASLLAMCSAKSSQ
ncbi:hypothetical protein PLESTB_000591900 [Pleodorina starrii]|uniref:Protein kinase domain-containing protein n=1 Tax=Pleodorina starrii TaxID=330485 RepID=A0A9W6BI18_9CHLO|nr:hypothetical protein PLESTM_000765200 [Pleodorina starrii]GLC52178.1 hypothetical protein PLESTB_000591900 [Pleodorina starrii]GLC75809.1 hypothetical protein PLESTF_001690000 [Pleodorina starrii]